MKVRIAVFAVALALIPTTAEAQQTHWRFYTIQGGCLFANPDVRISPTVVFTWSGQCNRGKPISGPGILRTTFGRHSEAIANGTFVDGVPHGDVTITKFLSGDVIQYFTERYRMGCEVENKYCTPFDPRVNERGEQSPPR